MLVAGAIAALLAIPVTIGRGTAAAAAADANTITLTAGEYTYKVSGKPKPGWVQLEFDNVGVEYHMAGMVALKPGVTVKQLKKALLSDDEDAGSDLVAGDGEVTPTPGILGPGQKAGNFFELKAGRYGLFCFIPAPDGTSHVEHGMVKVFDVKGSKSSFQPPTDGVIEVELSDSATTMPSTLPRSSTIKVTNEGATPRSLNLAKLMPGVTVEQADAYFDQLFEGAADGDDAPAVLTGGFEQLAPGQSTYLVLDLAAGSYGYANQDASGDDDVAPVLGSFTVS
jgi:hypothetical protein